MTVTVRYFQAARRWSGAETESVDLPAGACVGDLLDRLAASHPALEEARTSLMVAVNDEHAGADRSLAAGDEVAVMPPFSGG